MQPILENKRKNKNKKTIDKRKTLYGQSKKGFGTTKKSVLEYYVEMN